MQTTGLFSSSSPQQANVGGGSSLIGTLGAALVLVFGVVLLTGLSLDRTQTAMVRFLAEKGVALVTALESGRPIRDPFTDGHPVAVPCRRIGGSALTCVLSR